MKILKLWPLKDSYSIAQVDIFDVELHREQVRKYFVSDYPMLSLTFGLDDEAVGKLKQIRGNMASKYELKLVILHNDKMVGWTHGWQDSIEQDTFFMGSSLIVPEHQRQGLYSELVKKVLELTKEQGFQSISSLHVMTNNPVIIAKLKADFVIYGFEVNTRYGALVRLVHHHSEIKRNAIRFRAGALNETEFQKNILANPLVK